MGMSVSAHIIYGIKVCWEDTPHGLSEFADDLCDLTKDHKTIDYSYVGYDSGPIIVHRKDHVICTYDGMAITGKEPLFQTDDPLDDVKAMLEELGVDPISNPQIYLDFNMSM